MSLSSIVSSFKSMCVIKIKVCIKAIKAGLQFLSVQIMGELYKRHVPFDQHLK